MPVTRGEDVLWRHVKTGGVYRVAFVDPVDYDVPEGAVIRWGYAATDPIPAGSWVVHYEEAGPGTARRRWAREASQFFDGRFVRVDP